MLILDLCGKWQLLGIPQEEAKKLSIAKLPSEGWIEARVPGVVHLDLMATGKIPNPFFRINEKLVSWVEDFDWVYKREFEIRDGILNKDATELVFDGLDTFASIWVNGEHVGDVQNMFVQHRFDVKNFLRKGVNSLVVWFKSPKVVLEERLSKSDTKLKAAFYPPVVYGRKAQYSFGWDWGPRLPSVGIWKGVRLEALEVARIEDIHVRVKLIENLAKATVSIALTAYKEALCDLKLKLIGYDKVLVKKLHLQNGRNDAEFELEISDPELWWPSGYGKQKLYVIEVSLSQGPVELERKSVRFGVRKVELVQEQDDEGKSFIIKINDVPVFCKGANWVPADSFLPRVDRETYDRLLSLAKEANMNMLRVWGGGIYEDDAFYDLCDEKGIMIWQDFMFACGEYPESEWFLALVRDEAEKVVRRLRNHPSVVIWCGNNENDWGYRDRWWGDRERFFGESIYHKVLPEVCGALDPDRPYWPSSPYGGEHPNSQREGDRHSWEVWSLFRDYTEYRRDNGRFVSEFGFQALPSLETIKGFTLPEDRWPQSLVIEHHNKQTGGNERLYYFLSAHFKVPSTIEGFCEMTQINQGEALKVGIEHWRSRKFKTSGSLIWQLNDCWPVSSWSLVDYAHRKKAAYYYVKRMFAPVLVVLMKDDGMIRSYVVNDSLEGFSAELEIKGLTLNGKFLKSVSEEVSIPPNASVKVMDVELEELGISDTFNELVVAELWRGGKSLATSTCLLERPKHLKLPRAKAKVKLERVNHEGTLFRATVTSKAFIKSAHLRVRGVETEFEDNYFDVIPGIPKVVYIRTPKRFITKLPKVELKDVTSYA